MKELFNKLNTQSLAPIYLISTDELLLADDARQLIKNAAKNSGFSETEVLHIDSGFQWNTFLENVSSGQLFADKKIIDLRNPAAKFDTEVLKKILELKLNDLLIISTKKITHQQKNSVWFKLITQYGVHCPLWPIKFQEYPRWITKRAQDKQVYFDEEALLLLSHRTEGNLYAADQAIEKCLLLYPHEKITREKINVILTDNAQYTVFDLSDAISIKRATRAYRILYTLKQLDIEPNLILWSLARDIRKQLEIRAEVKQALQYAAKADEIIKGAVIGDPWKCFSDVINVLCGVYAI